MPVNMFEEYNPYTQGNVSYSEEKAQEILGFIQNLLSNYFQHVDTESLFEMMLPDASWFGIIEQDLAGGLESIKLALRAEQEKFPESVPVFSESYHFSPLTTDTCVAYGKLKVSLPWSEKKQDEVWITAVLNIAEGGIRLKHMHMSST